MPIILAQILRPLIIWIVQAGVTYVGFSILEKVIDKLLEAIKEHYDLEDDDARILLANNIIDVALVIGVGTTTLASKMPVKVAEKLGITSKMLVKKPLSTKGATKTKAKDLNNTSKTTAKTTVASKMKGMGKTNILLWLMLAQGIGDQLIFGRTALQQWINDIFGKGTIDIPGGKDAPPGFSQSEWDGFLTSIEASGVIGISNPKARQTQLFSKELLQDLMFWVYGEQVRKAESTTANALQKAVRPYLIFKGKTPTFNSNNNYSAVASAVAQPKATTPTQQVKVFTGVISQGALGQGLTFQERQDDLIENMDELRQASSNNLAPFLVSLPSRVRYEIKVVSSITTKDGFTQKGEVRQVQTGTYQNGQPKFKTVVNKFAVMDLFILTDRNTRTKLTTIVLGPTDAVKFQPNSNDLNLLNDEIPKTITTSNINEISNINVNSSINMEEQTQNKVPIYGDPMEEDKDTGFRFYKFEVNNETYFEPLPWVGNIPVGYTMITKQEYLDQELLLSATQPERWKGFFEQNRKRYPTAFSSGVSGYVIRDGVPYYVGNGSVNDTINSVTSASSNGNKPGSKALTLSEWYQLQGQSLPPVSIRSEEYERLGLGPRSYYTGTAEQNTRLLNALKKI